MGHMWPKSAHGVPGLVPNDAGTLVFTGTHVVAAVARRQLKRILMDHKDLPSFFVMLD